MGADKGDKSGEMVVRDGEAGEGETVEGPGEVGDGLQADGGV